METAIGIRNVGSTARDFCAIERNYLSHARLGLLLSLLSSSILLRSRLSSQTDNSVGFTEAAVPLSSVYFIASLCTVITGWYAYEESGRQMKQGVGFVGGFRIHEIVLSSVACLVAGTSLYLLVIQRHSA
ncbi:uncharacterized protein EI90DRAFT_521650 [Cantharellus anzutake]|uniref:uncharacterized protein n=1 Tax=Cantharellus anzutake TaxID=1750568 RepID=UPI001906EB36|nr:uncharacterized protein EI90DRAFT_521650 [Cantharellus anzutake]KAF8334194.1 hypothetical protein EI90DRAFT_521650 [Cantharellus anzutake]